MPTARTEAYLAAQAARVQLGDSVGDKGLLPDLVETMFDADEALDARVDLIEANVASRTIADQGVDVATLTAAEMLAGMIEGTPGAARDYTTDTAVNIVAAIAGAAIGSSFTFFINNKDGTNAITLVGGDGVTLDGTLTVAANLVRQFVATVTAVGTPAVTIWGVV